MTERDINQSPNVEPGSKEARQQAGLILRTQRLASGKSISQVVNELREKGSDIDAEYLLKIEAGDFTVEVEPEGIFLEES